MKILIVRHGDPDYAIDGLTEKGQREAALLADRLCREKITAVYCSTMGRAMRTAEPFLEKTGLEAQYCSWLREFNENKVQLPYRDRPSGCWDLMPEFVNAHPALYSPTEWMQVDFIRDSGVPQAYRQVCDELDRMLACHGYERSGLHYAVRRSHHDTILLICHYGISCVLLSHLMNCSPYSLFQNAFTAPTSVTTIYTEERVPGVASLRCSGIGDVSHLYAAGEEVSFSGRFCECCADDTRH